LIKLLLRKSHKFHLHNIDWVEDSHIKMRRQQSVVPPTYIANFNLFLQSPAELWLFNWSGAHFVTFHIITTVNKKFWEELIHLLSYISLLFEVLEPNLMELNLSELSLTSFSSTLFNQIYCSKQLGCHGYHGT
jgi:hypothetical protein